MTRFSKAILLGTAAGIVDVVPMIVQGLNWYANTSAFIQWIVLGIVITYLETGLKGWLKGLLVAEACVLPVMIIVSMNGIPGIIPIAISTAVLGCCIGYFADKYIGKVHVS